MPKCMSNHTMRKELEKINWKRVWLITLIVYTIGLLGSCIVNGVIYG